MSMTLDTPTRPKNLAASPSKAHILCVDDDQRLLDGLSRSLHGRYELTMCASPTDALDMVAAHPDRFEVILSDLRMPGLDGISLLAEVRALAPAVVRVLLTGFADVSAAMDAINRGAIFRFLTKPAVRDDVSVALDDAITQHRLIVSERELLEQTLQGSVRALLDTLALANPMAFARASRVQQTVTALARSLKVSSWQIETAAMLSQIGAVTLPPDLVAKLESGHSLSGDERGAVQRLPEMACQLLANIPRLDEVRTIITCQTKHFDGTGEPDNGIAGVDLPLGSRLLKIALDLDVLDGRNMARAASVQVLQGRVGFYDPMLLERLGPDQVLGREPMVHQIDVAALRAGMVMAEDLCDREGRLLLGRGHKLTDTLLGVLDGYVAKGRLHGRASVSDPGAG